MTGTSSVTLSCGVSLEHTSGISRPLLISVRSKLTCRSGCAPHSRFSSKGAPCTSETHAEVYGVRGWAWTLAESWSSEVHTAMQALGKSRVHTCQHTQPDPAPPHPLSPWRPLFLCVPFSKPDRVSSPTSSTCPGVQHLWERDSSAQAGRGVLTVQ